MNICIVDDYTKSINKTIEILSVNGEYKILFTAEHGGEFLQQLIKHKQEPDIVLMDLRMRKMDGCSTINYIKRYHNNIKVITLSGYTEYAAIKQAIAAGADGYVFKGEREKILLTAIEKVLNNGFYIDERIFAMLPKNQQRDLYSTHENYLKKITDTDTDTDTVIHFGNSSIKITKRELQYMQLSTTALDNTTIAAIMCIDKRTAETYYSRLAKKFNFQSVKEMAIFALQYGLTYNLSYELMANNIEIV